MKTTSRFHATLSLITIGLLACTGVVLATSDDYAENFELYSAGTVITNVSGWTATETNSVIVSTNYTASYQGGAYPIDYDHTINTKALEIVNGVSNTIAAGTAGITNWVDVVIKPVKSDDTPELPPAGSVAACYFNTNMNLVVLYAPTWDTTAWLEIPDVSIVEGDWIRLTIAANMADGDEFDDFARFYQIYINGTVVTNAAAYQTPSSLSGVGGSWFASGASIVRTDPITNVVVKGTGFLDDLVVTNALTLTPPDPPQPTYIATLPTVSELTEGDTLGDAVLTGGSATNAAGGTVDGLFAFAAPATVPPLGTNTYDVVFTPDQPNLYLTATGQVDVVVVAAGPQPTYIATLPSVSELTEGDTLGDAVLTGGSATNATGATVAGAFDFASPSTVPPVGTTSYDMVFTPTDTNAYLSATGQVDVVVLAATTTNGTPTTWYDQFGITPTGEQTYDDLDLLDSDGDGVLNWKEYIAGTDPMDPESSFRLIGIEFDVDGKPILQWYGGTNGPPATVSYIVESVTNLAGTITWDDMSNTAPRQEGTNTWTGTVGPRRFYRVRATAE